MSQAKGCVHVVDDDQHLRESIADLLQFAGYEVITWPSAQSFLEGFRYPDLPAVIVTDMRMPGLNGLDLHQAMAHRHQGVPVIYISGETSVQQSITAMKLGAVDFLLKPFTAQGLLTAIEKGLSQDQALRQQRHDRQTLEGKLDGLTRREREVFMLLIKGHNNAEIMQALNLSLPTTKQYKGAVMKKLGVSSLAQLIAWGNAGGIESN